MTDNDPKSSNSSLSQIPPPSPTSRQTSADLLEEVVWLDCSGKTPADLVSHLLSWWRRGSRKKSVRHVLVQHLGELKGSIASFLLQLYDAHRTQGVQGVLLDPSGFASALDAVLHGDPHLRVFAPRRVPVLPVRILVVENQTEGAKTLCRLLESYNGICRVVGTAGEACRILAATRWDVVLLDMGLPGAQSLRVAKFVKERAMHAALIGFTDSDETWVHEITLLYGFRRLISKPCSFPDILEAIQSLEIRRTPPARPS